MTKARDIADNAGKDGGSKNIIVNGAMKIAQRSVSETGLGSADGYFTVDRFKIDVATASAGRFTMSQHSDGPSGFANCIKLDCTTADTSIAAGERLILRHIIEGQDLQQLKKGTSDAETFTVSFYVKGDAAATYSLSLYDGDNGRMISQTFNVTTSWNRIELTFAGDTTGAFDDDNGASLFLDIFLHAGTDYTSGTLQTSWGANANANRAVGISSFFDSTNREFYITGYQLEVNDKATDFEHRTFGDELARCQRYFYKTQTGGGTAEYFYTILDGASSDYIIAFLDFPTSMRAVPSGTTTHNGALYYNTGSGGTNFTPTGGSDFSAGVTEDRGRIGQATITNNPGSTHVQKLGQWYCAGEFDAEL